MTNVNKNSFFQASAKDFEKIPGAPIAYWVSNSFLETFSHNKVNDFASTNNGFTTGDNNLFLREWFEVSFASISFNNTSIEASEENKAKWYPYNKGGEFRKWYGNNDFIINWEHNGQAIKAYGHLVPRSLKYQFRESISWNKITSGTTAFRYKETGTMFDVAGLSMFPYKSDNLYYFLALCNSIYTKKVLEIISPTLNCETGHISALPVIISDKKNIVENITLDCIKLSRLDWDSFELSWNFKCHPLVRKPMIDISLAYAQWEKECEQRFYELKRNEEELNRIFIDIYGLNDELKSEVEDKDVSVSKADIGRDIRSFLSYAVGCMFGRYSLDKPGLILANQGETLVDYLKQIPQPTFTPDEDNVIPILAEDWFDDDIVSRFNEFLKVTFGEEHFIDNQAFIEEAIGKDVRSYFTKDFYKEHLQRYHNRPIYWLFSSPKGAFSALIYIHRYRPETVGLVLTYLRSHITKVTQRIHSLETTIDSAESTAGMKSKAMRERAKLQKDLRELEDYERDVLYPLSTEKIAIDLDDGVKVNYRKFGDALYKIKGLEAKEE